MMVLYVAIKGFINDSECCACHVSHLLLEMPTNLFIKDAMVSRITATVMSCLIVAECFLFFRVWMSLTLQESHGGNIIHCRTLCVKSHEWVLMTDSCGCLTKQEHTTYY